MRFKWFVYEIHIPNNLTITVYKEFLQKTAKRNKQFYHFQYQQANIFGRSGDGG
jgi:hypothetical protein